MRRSRTGAASVRSGAARGAVVGASVLGLLVGTAALGVAQEDGADRPGVVRDPDRWLLNDELAGGAADHDFRYGPADATTHVTGDWNGDGERTPGVVRVDGDLGEDDGPHTLVWYLRNSHSGGPADIVLHYGQMQAVESSDIPVVGDWNGDGIETVGVVRPDHASGTHRWLLRDRNTSGYPDHEFSYGRPGSFPATHPERPRDLPVVGDWNGDGTTTPGVVRQDPAAGTSRWLLRDLNAGGAADRAFHYGRDDDAPVVGDWDGDGTQTAGILRDRNRWLLRDDHRGGAAAHAFRFGRADDWPVVW